VQGEAIRRCYIKPEYLSYPRTLLLPSPLPYAKPKARLPLALGHNIWMGPKPHVSGPAKDATVGFK